MTSFIGKYRGVVTNNTDDDNLGRIYAQVPDVYGENSEPTRAMPCVPYAGKGVGLFLLPPVGASVWIEFEQGDPDYPIWSGCFWVSGEVPATPASPDMKVLKTGVGSITLDDTQGAGGIIIETVNGMKITINQSGIEIDNGQNAVISLSGPTVSVNNSALEVT